MNEVKVTERMVRDAGYHWSGHLPMRSDLERLGAVVQAALTHPDFRKQVAELMRGMVPAKETLYGGMPDQEEYIYEGINRARTEALARIEAWENQENANGT